MIQTIIIILWIIKRKHNAFNVLKTTAGAEVKWKKKTAQRKRAMKGNKTTNWMDAWENWKEKTDRNFFFSLLSRTDLRHETQMITNVSCYACVCVCVWESERKERRKLVRILGWGSILLLLLLGSPGDQCNFNDVQSQFQNHFSFSHTLILYSYHFALLRNFFFFFQILILATRLVAAIQRNWVHGLSEHQPKNIA